MSTLVLPPPCGGGLWPWPAKAGVASAVVATVGLLIAELGTGSPVLAGIAMAVVCLLTSLSFAGGKIAKVVGLMLGTAYFLPAALGLVDALGADMARAAEALTQH